MLAFSYQLRTMYSFLYCEAIFKNLSESRQCPVCVVWNHGQLYPWLPCHGEVWQTMESTNYNFRTLPYFHFTKFFTGLLHFICFSVNDLETPWLSCKSYQRSYVPFLDASLSLGSKTRCTLSSSTDAFSGSTTFFPVGRFTSPINHV